MKILLDTCVWGKAADLLTTAGHDVFWSGDWDEDPGDEEILEQLEPRAGFWSRSIRTLASLRSYDGFPIAAFSASPAFRRECKPRSFKQS